RETFDGIVLGGQPVPISRISAELGMSRHTVRKHVIRLVSTGYIDQRHIVGDASAYVVRNSKKWVWRRKGVEAAVRANESDRDSSQDDPSVVGPLTADGHADMPPAVIPLTANDQANKERAQVLQNRNRNKNR